MAYFNKNGNHTTKENNTQEIPEEFYGDFDFSESAGDSSENTGHEATGTQETESSRRISIEELQGQDAFLKDVINAESWKEQERTNTAGNTSTTETKTDYAGLYGDIRGLDKDKLINAGAPKGLIDRLSQGWSAAAELTKQRGRGIETDIQFSIVKKGKYILNPKPLLFRGLVIVSARTSGGKTLNLTSLMSYLLTRVQNKRAEKRKELIARINAGGKVTQAEIDANKEIFCVMLSLEEPANDIYARCFAGYCEYMQDLEEKKIYGQYPVRVKPRPTIDQLEQALNGEDITIDPENKIDVATVKATMQMFQPEFDAHVSIISQESVNRLVKQDYENRKKQAEANGEKFNEVKPNPEQLKDVTVICDYIKELKKSVDYCNMQFVCFLDYIQRAHPSEGDSSYSNNGYKQVQKVIEQITELTASGTVIFAAAQMNRDNSKEVRNDKQKEFINAICEEIREGADIEQGADMVLYGQICNDCTTDGKNRLAVRTLKCRGGIREQATFAEIHWDTKTAVYDNELFNIDLIPQKSAMETTKAKNNKNAEKEQPEKDEKPEKDEQPEKEQNQQIFEGMEPPEDPEENGQSIFNDILQSKIKNKSSNKGKGKGK